MDFITGLPPSPDSNGRVYDAVLVVVDMFSKFTVYLPCTKDIDAKTFAELLFNRYFSLFGGPKNIVSGRGNLFTSEFWSPLCFLLLFLSKVWVKWVAHGPAEV
jgi:hypothetical protein